MANELIVQNGNAIAISNAANAAKMQALVKAALIEQVTTPDEQEKAVNAQAECNKLIKEVEKQRKALKEPVIELGRMIDQTAKDFNAELTAEQNRLACMVADYQMTLAEKAREEARRADRERAEIEARARAEAEAAKTDDKKKEILEKAQAELEMVKAPAEAPKAAGQSVRKDWEINITNIHDLYRSHPNCVKMEARLDEIRQLLAMGITPKGITAKEVLKCGTRSNAARVIDV